MQAIRDSSAFLLRLALLHMGQALAVIFCAAELVAAAVLWVMAIWWWSADGHPSAMLLPIAFSLLLYLQYALWQHTWLRLAQRGGGWRAVAEVFTMAVRYPVVRTPHPWE